APWLCSGPGGCWQAAPATAAHHSPRAATASFRTSLFLSSRGLASARITLAFESARVLCAPQEPPASRGRQQEHLPRWWAGCTGLGRWLSTWDRPFRDSYGQEGEDAGSEPLGEGAGGGGAGASSHRGQPRGSPAPAWARCR
uniref:Uncharacterized protein n=1 Tax=Anas platyrhynchos TaxID=8839 RepID=A0A8B9SM71_ANAPL